MVDEVTLSDMMQHIIDSIYIGISGEDPTIPGQPGVNAGKLMLILEYPGNPIDPADFVPDPADPQGVEKVAENLYLLVDDAPLISTIKLTSSGTPIGSTYKDLILANASSTNIVEPSDEDKEKLKAAYALLEDPETLEPTQKKIRYDIRKKAYEDARMEYFQKKFEFDLSTPAGASHWASISPSLKGRVQTAYDNFRAANATEIETAIGNINQMEAKGLNSFFNKLTANMEIIKKTGPQLGNDYYPVKVFPTNWTSPDASFNELTVTQSNTKIDEQSDFKKLGGRGFLSLGGWFAGGSGGSNAERQHLSTETHDFKMKFRYGRVELKAPWHNRLIYDLEGWKVAGMAKGGISSGEKSLENKGILPLIPTAFIVIRDLEISATWGSSDSEFITKAVNGGGTFGCGFFAIGGNYKKGSSSKKIESSFDGTTLRVLGPQLSMWVCDLNRECPPETGIA